MTTHSCIYKGTIEHHRLAPVDHRFQYRLFMMYLDLDELPELFTSHRLWGYERPGLGQFRRRDFHGPANTSLKDAVLDTVQQHLNHRPAGAVRLLTHLRYYGFIYNPVSFYYCFDSANSLEAIVAEINNTPWDERHSYVMDVRHGQPCQRGYQFTFDKTFHVSPFMPMDLHYQWQFSVPDESLFTHMQNHDGNSKTCFTATLAMKRQAITRSSMTKVLIHYPLMTVNVITAIYWQALRLRLKKVPFFTHPNKLGGQHVNTCK